MCFANFCVGIQLCEVVLRTCELEMMGVEEDCVFCSQSLLSKLEMMGVEEDCVFCSQSLLEQRWVLRRTACSVHNPF